MLTLAEIKAEVDHLSARINASGYVLPTYGCSNDGGRPHIEVDARGYHFVTVERGQELKRITTCDLDELLFHIFEAVTFNLACDYELAHRMEHQDFRRVMFFHQIELLSVLSQKWSEREYQEHERILHEHPYDDRAGARASLTAKAGWKVACEKYPLPGNSPVNPK